jgi:cytochrome P450
MLASLPTPRNRRILKAKARLDDTIYRMIAERRAKPGGRDLLSMLLEAQHEDGSAGMTDEQVRDEAMTIFLAGHETTAVALTWTLYLLSQHPEADARLREELDRVLGGRLPTVQDVPKLAYTRQVFAEGMRLFPPAWVLGRRAEEDVQVGEWGIPRGSVVVMSQWVAHRDPRWWRDPEAFDPARFAPGADDARPKYAYFPFGGGPRVCIGEPFAWMEGVLLLAVLCQRWRFAHDPAHEVALQPLITLRPRYGMRMRVTRA